MILTSHFFAMELLSAHPSEVCSAYLMEYSALNPHSRWIWLRHWDWLFDRIGPGQMLYCVRMLLGDSNRTYDPTLYGLMAFDRLVRVVGLEAAPLYMEFAQIFEDCPDDMVPNIRETIQRIRASVSHLMPHAHSLSE
jgi:hypothetical protein